MPKHISSYLALMENNDEEKGALQKNDVGVYGVLHSHGCSAKLARKSLFLMVPFLEG
jgi:hypothetical protein